jgi:hypothetical protein
VTSTNLLVRKSCHICSEARLIYTVGQTQGKVHRGGVNIHRGGVNIHRLPNLH